MARKGSRFLIIALLGGVGYAVLALGGGSLFGPFALNIDVAATVAIFAGALCALAGVVALIIGLVFLIRAAWKRTAPGGTT